jgi:hypothetical protein
VKDDNMTIEDIGLTFVYRRERIVVQFTVND